MCLGPENLGMSLFSLTSIFLENTASPTPSGGKVTTTSLQSSRESPFQPPDGIPANKVETGQKQGENLVIPADQLR